jgi:hypothetical protein
MKNSFGLVMSFLPLGLALPAKAQDVLPRFEAYAGSGYIRDHATNDSSALRLDFLFYVRSVNHISKLEAQRRLCYLTIHISLVTDHCPLNSPFLPALRGDPANSTAPARRASRRRACRKSGTDNCAPYVH